jgi:hypothetical protein
MPYPEDWKPHEFWTLIVAVAALLLAFAELIWAWFRHSGEETWAQKEEERFKEYLKIHGHLALEASSGNAIAIDALQEDRIANKVFARIEEIMSDEQKLQSYRTHLDQEKDLKGKLTAFADSLTECANKVIPTTAGGVPPGSDEAARQAFFDSAGNIVRRARKAAVQLGDTTLGLADATKLFAELRDERAALVKTADPKWGVH